MQNILRVTKSLFLLLILSSCATLQEPFKVMWGSSTRALEKARSTAVSKEFPCELNQCFAAVEAFVNRQAQTVPSKDVIQEADAKEAARVSTDTQHEQGLSTPLKTMKIFIKNPRRHFMVVMGIPGSIDTTEVGVFFTAAGETKTVVEVSSLSRYAKARAAEILFAQLQKDFSPPELTTADATTAETQAASLPELTETVPANAEIPLTP